MKGQRDSGGSALLIVNLDTRSVFLIRRTAADEKHWYLCFDWTRKEDGIV